jgi:predicted nuclease of predicted toxin-antitoxin system
VTQLTDVFVESAHLIHHALERATDAEVWKFAHSSGFTLVTKDSDFHDLSLLRGAPPQVIWLHVGNCTTAYIETLLRQHQSEIEQLTHNATAGVLVLR